MALKVVSVNTYAGSLLLGAVQGSHEVVASLEDEKAYGVDVQRLNFGGEFPILAQNPRYWRVNAEGNLRGHVVIAHPPCSAFSGQNNSALRQGLGSEAFDCTRKVLDFGMSGRADAVIVESVLGALEGARAVHDEYAARHGYAVFRLVLNSASFGVPQERERFWIIFARRNAFDARTLFIEFKDQVLPVRIVTDATTGRQWYDQVPADASRDMMKQLDKWERCGIGYPLMSQLVSGYHGYGMLNTRIGGSKDAKLYQQFSFGTRNVRLLDPDGLATVLLSDSLWMIPDAQAETFGGELKGGRLINEGEYKALMGFPRDYRFPEKYRAGRFREYLSKGVCPPVARWVLDQVERNMAGLNDYGATHFVKDGDLLRLHRGPVRRVDPPATSVPSEVTASPSEGLGNPPPIPTIPPAPGDSE